MKIKSVAVLGAGAVGSYVIHLLVVPLVVTALEKARIV